MNKIYFLDLPDVLLESIVKYLPFVDIYYISIVNKQLKSRLNRPVLRIFRDRFNQKLSRIDEGRTLEDLMNGYGPSDDKDATFRFRLQGINLWNCLTDQEMFRGHTLSLYAEVPPNTEITARGNFKDERIWTQAMNSIPGVLSFQLRKICAACESFHNTGKPRYEYMMNIPFPDGTPEFKSNINALNSYFDGKTLCVVQPMITLQAVSEFNIDGLERSGIIKLREQIKGLIDDGYTFLKQLEFYIPPNPEPIIMRYHARYPYYGFDESYATSSDEEDEDEEDEEFTEDEE
jgi:hypothetical protein